MTHLPQSMMTSSFGNFPGYKLCANQYGRQIYDNGSTPSYSTLRSAIGDNTTSRNIPRPRSIYCYPEENSVVVSRNNFFNNSSSLRDKKIGICPKIPNLHENKENDTIYRANKVIVNSNNNTLPRQVVSADDSPPFVANLKRQYAIRRTRPTSMAVPGNQVDDLWSRINMLEKYDENRATAKKKLENCGENSFTFDDVKRLLDPKFISSKAPSSTCRASTLSLHQSAGTLNGKSADSGASTVPTQPVNSGIQML